MNGFWLKTSHLLFRPAGMAVFCASTVGATLIFREPLPAPKHELRAPITVSIAPVEIPTFVAPARPLVLAPRATPAKVAVAKRSVKRYPRKHTKARYHSQWRSRRDPLMRSALAREFSRRNQFVDSELNADFASDATIVNGWQPEMAQLDRALDEAPLAESDYSVRKLAEAQVDVELALGVTYAEEARWVETAGSLSRNDFTEIRESLEQLKAPDFYQWKASKPEPVLVKKAAKKRPILAERDAPKPSRGRTASAKVFPSTTARRSQTTATLPEAAVVTTAPGVAPEKVVAEINEALAAAPVRTERETTPPSDLSTITPPSAPAPVLDASAEFAATAAAKPSATSPTAIALGPVLAAAGSAISPKISMVPPAAASAADAPTVTTQPQPPARRVSRAIAATTAPVSKADDGLSDMPFDTDLMGKFYASESLAKWLEAEKAHIELYLQPVGTHDPQGTRYLSFQYPQQKFRDEAKALRGRYRLVAGIFRRQDIDLPYGEIPYRDEINAATAKTQIKFFADLKDIQVTAQSSGSHRRHVNVSLSLFEGAAGEYRDPKPLAGVEVQVIGFPEYGTLKTDSEGNLTLASVPNHSQIVLEFRTKGYFRTQRTVPIFGADVHVPIYMISKEKVDLLTRTLVGVRQVAELATVMGRVFDPESRNPLEGEAFEMADQPARAGSYFGLLVDSLLPRTTAQGFYSYFNVAENFRYLSRPESNKRTFRLNVRPGSGYYVELGRGGMSSFRGRLLDPNAAELPEARITLVGDTKFETFTNTDGTFEIPGIDFPSGVIAIDVQAEGYPLTRHTIPWNPRQTASVRDLFMVQSRFIEQSIASSQNSDFGPNPSSARDGQVGNLIGGAYGGLFEGLRGSCLRVELWSVEGARPVESSYGPFPFRGSLSPNETLCLTPQRPGFNYLGLPPGEYLLKWKDDAGKVAGARSVHIGMGRDSIAVN